MTSLFAPLLMGWLLAAAPPLTDAQREQLATADDGSRRVDEGALYPLLRNVSQWQPEAAVRAWVDVYHQALLDEPASFRGELVRVEGTFYGRPSRFALQRSGEWGEAVTLWMLVLERDPERFAIVLLVDPDGHWHEHAPRPGQRVHVTTRFYKLWTIEDERNVLTDYLTFVGRSPHVIGPPVRTDNGGAAVGQMLLLLALAVAALLLVVWRSRGLSLQPRPLARQRLHREATAVRAPAGDEPEPMESSLPDDPAAALDELSRRRDGES